jgi:hypothetical protein
MAAAISASDPRQNVGRGATGAGKPRTVMCRSDALWRPAVAAKMARGDVD